MRSVAATFAVLWLLWPAIAPGQAAAPDAAVVAAVARLDAARQDDEWFFTLSLTEDEEQRVIRHDPTADPYQQRTLVSVDGESPSKKRLEVFRDEEKKRVDDRDPEASYGYLVNLDSLRWLETEQEISRFAFAPRVKALDEHADKMLGLLTFNTVSGEVEHIEIYNAEPFSPAFSVTLDTYRLSFAFREEQGARLLRRMESKAVGKAGFLKRFDNDLVVDFSEYRRVGEQPAPFEQ